MAYSPTLWKRGDIITAEKLNKVETGLQAAASVDIQSAQATTLAAGAPATAVIEGGVLKLGIPRGQTGAQGAKGDQGERGAAGAAGKNGSCFRVSATALADSQTGIAATALTPTNAQLPYAVGDIVLDATTKKLYAVTAASGGTCSIGTALATLP